MRDLRHVVLVGLMGSGKTTVGRLVARRLGWPLVDNDVELGRRIGMTAREFTAREGLDALHRAEAETLAAMLDVSEPSVIGAAASVVESPLMRDRLERHYVVWLDADPEVLAARAANGSHRPHLPAAQLQAARSALYEQISALRVDTTHMSPEDAAAYVAEALADGR
ncbi:MAG TPA: shikimate kinase [Acidimicrobiia bacterium]|nr:shikimate kinase [Acidimicrobiia bacterium]